MLVFPVVVVWRFFWKNQTEKNTRTKQKHFYFNASLQFQSNFHRWNKRQRWLADGPMEKSRSIFVNHKPLGKVTKYLDFQVWKKTTDLKPLTHFRLPPQPLRISGHDNEEGFFRGKNSTKISCFDIFTSRNHRGSVGPWKLNCNPAIRRPGQTRRLHCGFFWSSTMLGYVVRSCFSPSLSGEKNGWFTYPFSGAGCSAGCSPPWKKSHFVRRVNTTKFYRFPSLGWPYQQCFRMATLQYYKYIWICMPSLKVYSTFQIMLNTASHLPISFKSPP